MSQSSAETLLRQRPWLQAYPSGVPAEPDLRGQATLLDLLDEACRQHAAQPAFRFMGQDLSYAELDHRSRAFAAWLQAQGLRPGERVAVMLPNVPQYPVVVAGILRAGLVLVNVNPLYTAPELAHQLIDADAPTLIVLENFAHVAQQALEQAPAPMLQRVVVTGVGDLLGGVKRWLVNAVVRHVKKQVPAWNLPQAVPLMRALREGERLSWQPPPVTADTLAVLQYTGGTTGVAKGAMLLHRNLLANVAQAAAWFEPARRTIGPHQFRIVCALPLYHVFAFTSCMFLGLRLGGCNLLIPNPRDLKGLLATLSKEVFHYFPAVNTLYQAIADHPDASRVDWRHLKLSIGGGMAVLQATAERWRVLTGNPMRMGYGLSETSPVVSCNPVDMDHFDGTIGLPLPGTEVAILDDAGNPVAQGQPGEIAVRGPQVMAGYWRRPDETALVLRADGWFLTGDIGIMEADGRFRIVDRKKDMILVSGFNVYPNEVEDVVAQMPGVAECGVTGVPDAHSGEAVKLVIVRRDPALQAEAVRAWCHERLTPYKRPRHIEFRDSLPKTTVGKVLRRALR